MRKYEFTIILETNEDNAAKGLEVVEAQFAKYGVEISKRDDMGIRQLAYVIKKQDKGHYIYFEIQADPQSLAKMEREFLLAPGILKYLFVVAKDRKQAEVEEAVAEESAAEEAPVAPEAVEAEESAPAEVAADEAAAEAEGEAKEEN